YYIETGRVLEISKRFIREAFPVSRVQKWGRTWRARLIAPGFQLVSGEISIQSPRPFQFLEDDENVLRIFLYAKEHAARIADPILEVIHQVTEKKQGVPLPPGAALLFRELLSRPGMIAEMLRIMHRTHFLWRIIPEFSRVHCLVQVSRSHAFTVDEHSIRAVEAAERLLDEEGLLREIYIGIQRKDILHLALLLHDIGKGNDRDHSQLGGETAEAVATRLGYDDEEKGLLIFLVRRHLIFSDVALYRDFSNEPILLQFAKEVARPETLRKLFVLTSADIRAVAPGTWTSWKGDLLTRLYKEAFILLAGEEPGPQHKKVDAILERIRQSVHGEYPAVWLDEILPGLTSRYLLMTPFKKILTDLPALFRLRIDPIRINARYLPDLGVTEYTLYTDDRVTPGLFSKMTGVLAAKGLQIMAAQVYTMSNGMVVDTFQAVDPDYAGPVPADRIATISDEVKSVLTEKETVENLFSKNDRFQSRKKGRSSFQPVRVECDNDSSHAYTIIDIFASDRRGLLYVIAKAIFDLGLVVHSAKIATRLDQVVDIFYVSCPDQKKLTDPERIRSVKSFLKDRIEGHLSSTGLK
ncbi:MAG: HD domain-containing protein, partial [Nitrospiria bacterium]